MSLAHQIQSNGIAAQAIAMRDSAPSLPAMVQRAAQQLASATTAAEVLDARDMASVAYDAAKKAARLHKAKGAHDTLIATAHRAQADALEIEAAAKRRLADEYDAAQERGEVQRHGGQGKRDIPEQNIPSAEEIGLTAKDIHEARQIRDAEEAEPGIVSKTVEEQLAAGKEPTKAAVRKAVEAVNNQEAKEVLAVVDDVIETKPRNKFTLPDGVNLEDIARKGMARETTGEAAEAIAKSFGIGAYNYRQACDVVFLFDRGGYSERDTKTVVKAFRMMVDEQRVSEARELVDPIAVKVWGASKSHGRRADREPARIDQFEHAFGVVMHTCVTAAELDLPYLSAADVKSAVKEINAARRNLQTLLSRIQELHNV